MKNLFFFTNAYPCNISLEAYIDNEIEFLSRQFHKVYIFPVDFGPVLKPIPENVEVVKLDKYISISKIGFLLNLFQIIKIFISGFIHYPNKWFYLRSAKANFLRINNACETGKAILKFAKESKLDVDQVTFYTYWFYHSAFALSILKDKKQIRGFISRGHQGDVYQSENNTNSKLFFQYYMLSMASHLFVISKHARAYLLKNFPKFQIKISVSYLGTEDHSLSDIKDPNSFVIASCSKFSDNKRVFMIPEILNLLDFPVHWIHFGYSGETDVAKVKLAISKLPSHVHVELMGFRKNHEILKFYRENQINMFVNLSVKEGLSVAVMEAMSFGIPPLATDTNATAELVTPENGFLVPVNFDIREIAQLITAFRYSIQEKKREAARAHYLKYFQSEDNYNSFVNLLYNY